MASNLQQAYGTTTAITLTLASLASSLLAGRESALIDNTAGLFFDAQLELAIKLNATAPTGDIFVTLAGSVDAGTLWDMPASGASAGITLIRTTPWDLLEDLCQRGAQGIKVPGSSLTYLGRIDCVGQAGAATVVQTFKSLANACGATGLPPKFTIQVWNQTGSAFDSTEGNHTKKYTGLFNTAS